MARAAGSSASSHSSNLFVDEVDIHVEAGAGGRGCLAFRREKFVPRGGPSGGDGGHGGSVYIGASPHINTLINFRFHPLFDAERGEHGMGSNCTGRGGKDLELEVPIGTLVYEKIAANPKTLGSPEDPQHPENPKHVDDADDPETPSKPGYRLVADLAHE